MAADSVAGGRRSGSQSPAPLNAQLVPLPPLPEPPNRPPPPSRQIPGPSPRPQPPVTSCPNPRHLARSKTGSRHTEALTCPPLQDPAKYVAASAAEAGLPFSPLPDRAPSGRKRPPRRTGRGSGRPAAWGQLPTGWHLGAGAVPDTNRRDPAPYPGRGLAPRLLDRAEAAASS